MHDYGVTVLVLRSWHRSAGVTRPSQLILAHAPDHNPPADFGFPTSAGPCRLLRAPAGRWPFPTLSLRSLYRRLGPYPATTERCSRPFLPVQHRPPLRCKRIGSWKHPTKQLHVGRYSRGCNHSLTFRLPYLLGPPTVLTIRNCIPSATGPYTPGSTCAVTGHRLRHHYVSEPDN